MVAHLNVNMGQKSAEGGYCDELVTRHLHRGAENAQLRLGRLNFDVVEDNAFARVENLYSATAG